MLCKKCGSEMPDDAIFCTECGARIENEPAPDVHTDDEPTSILPHLEEVIAANEETLSLTHEEVELLNDEPAEILSSSDTIELPEPEPVTEVFTAPKPEPVKEEKPEKPAEFPKQEAPAVPVSNDGFNDNSNTMRIPVQPQQNGSDNINNNTAAKPAGNAPQQGGIIPPPPVQPVQQPAPAPAPAPMPKQEDKPKARKKVGGGRIFGASLVTIFTILFLLAFSLTLAVKIGANGNVIRKRASKLNASTTLSAQFDGKELSKTLYDSMGFRTATRGAADEAGFKRYMMNTDFREYMGRVAKDYLDYIIDGKGDDPSITAEDFVDDFLKVNNDAAVEEFEYELTDSGYELIEKNLEKDNFSDTLSVKEWSRKLGFDVDKCSYAFSFITIGILGGLVILFLIWTAVILAKRARFVTGFFATVFNVVGILVFLSGLAILIGSAIAFTFTHNAGYYLAETLLLPFTVLLLIIGAAELFLGFIFRKSNRAIKKKAKKAAAVAASAEKA
ncbi:MAG: zinc-ribbon domain-containing protein [Ruminococcus sp.]|nr:zinc-ribbon domain-containing protein [Ruminococcus sp.]